MGSITVADKKPAATTQALGGAGKRGKPFSCKACGKGVSPMVDAMTIEGESDGFYCRECWKHLWVEHRRANIPEGPMCRMGVRFSAYEWQQIQDLIHGELYRVGLAAKRFPTVDEMTVPLSRVKKSLVCPEFGCAAQVTFTLEPKDIAIPGVNVPWPQNMPYPWQQQNPLAGWQPQQAGWGR